MLLEGFQEALGLGVAEVECAPIPGESLPLIASSIGNAGAGEESGIKRPSHAHGRSSIACIGRALVEEAS